MKSENHRELDNIDKKIKNLRIIGSIFFLIWLPIFMYQLWIDWDYIQKYGFVEGAIKNLSHPVFAITWIFCFIVIVIVLSIRNNENKKKKILEKIKNEKKCPSCNRVIPSDSNICPYCGKRF